jgi:hypothetical protein
MGGAGAEGGREGGRQGGRGMARKKTWGELGFPSWATFPRPRLHDKLTPTPDRGELLWAVVSCCDELRCHCRVPYYTVGLTWQLPPRS